jgi:CheY-like chemotaxis protein
MNALILVVDDEPDVADLFRQQFRKELRAARFVMEFALSAADALERVHAPKAAKLILILSDINMPGMSGLDLRPRARQARPDVPVIMIALTVMTKRGGRRRKPERRGCSPSRSTSRNSAAKSDAGWTPPRVPHDGEGPGRRRRARP